MKTKLIAGIFLLIAVLATAQTPPEPNYWVAAGGGFNHLAGRQTHAWFSLGARVTEGYYSFSTMDMTGQVATMRTGVARVLSREDRFTLLGLGDGGLASGGDQFGMAFSGGAVVAYELGRLLKVSGLHLTAIVSIRKTTLNEFQPVFSFGIGKTFP